MTATVVTTSAALSKKKNRTRCWHRGFSISSEWSSPYDKCDFLRQPVKVWSDRRDMAPAFVLLLVDFAWFEVNILHDQHRLVESRFSYHLRLPCQRQRHHWTTGSGKAAIAARPPMWSSWLELQAMTRSSTFTLHGSLTGRLEKLMIFALAILRVLSSLPAFGFIILLCGLWSIWSDV